MHYILSMNSQRTTLNSWGIVNSQDNSCVKFLFWISLASCFVIMSSLLFSQNVVGAAEFFLVPHFLHFYFTIQHLFLCWISDTFSNIFLCWLCSWALPFFFCLQNSSGMLTYGTSLAQRMYVPPPVDYLLPGILYLLCHLYHLLFECFKCTR